MESYVKNVIFPKKLSICTFRASQFTDLPETNWDYLAIVITGHSGGNRIFACRYTSGQIYYKYSYWDGGWPTTWDKIASTSDIPASQWLTLPYTNSYYCINTVTAPDGKRPLVTLAGASINVDDVLAVRTQFVDNNNWQIIATSNQKFSSGDTVNVILIYA